MEAYLRLYNGIGGNLKKLKVALRFAVYSDEVHCTVEFYRVFVNLKILLSVEALGEVYCAAMEALEKIVKGFPESSMDISHHKGFGRGIDRLKERVGEVFKGEIYWKEHTGLHDKFHDNWAILHILSE